MFIKLRLIFGERRPGLVNQALRSRGFLVRQMLRERAVKPANPKLGSDCLHLAGKIMAAPRKVFRIEELQAARLPPEEAEAAGRHTEIMQALDALR